MARSRPVLGQPFGRTLLLVVVVGLLGYAAWRILQGLFDPDRLGNNWRGLGIRASFVARGALHAVLGWQAFRLYRGLSAASGTSEREVATEAFRWPLGDWLVVLAGLGSMRGTFLGGMRFYPRPAAAPRSCRRSGSVLKAALNGAT